MYIHIGGDAQVPVSEVTAVIDLETVLPSQKDINSFIRAEDDNNRLQYLTGEIPKSLVLTTDRTYVSPMSSAVLSARLEAKTYDL